MDGDDKEEKSRLIQQVFSLQNTLDGKKFKTSPSLFFIRLFHSKSVTTVFLFFLISFLT